MYAIPVYPIATIAFLALKRMFLFASASYSVPFLVTLRSVTIRAKRQDVRVTIKVMATSTGLHAAYGPHKRLFGVLYNICIIFRASRHKSRNHKQRRCRFNAVKPAMFNYRRVCPSGKKKRLFMDGIYTKKEI
jgi:hypothetical protein